MVEVVSTKCFGSFEGLLTMGGSAAIFRLVEVDQRGENGLLRGVKVLPRGVFVGFISALMIVGHGCWGLGPC